MFLPIAVKTFNLGDVSLVFLDDIGINTRYRGVMAKTTPLALAPRTSLVLVLLTCQALIGGRLLVLVTRCVSRRS